MVTEQELRETYEHALECVICFCGNYKRMGKPFCFRCFDSLPSDWQGQYSIYTSLRYDRSSTMLPHHYDAAKQWLKAKRGPSPSQDSLQ